eukprot:TRINITY_DN2638_c0_g1_i1.p1 TRINITY_DN2638_c0_g1~~TRINITY_DN2638_c0_g1_i1.p1  ORF type:complete len:684 (+),score=83.42 TRINITY_DN2638_c0_g1_i1:1014-3065(+)
MLKAVEEEYLQREERRKAAEIERTERPKRQQLYERTCKWSKIVLMVNFFRWAREKRSIMILTELFTPIWHAHWFMVTLRRKRKQLLDENLEHMQRPDPSALRGNSLFGKWPERNLVSLLSTCQPICYEANECIAHQGDWGDRMYFIDSGEVEIIVRSNKGKSRGRRNGVCVATLSNGAYFGEFAIMNDEPRMASIWCKTQCNLWFLKKAAFEKEFQCLPESVKATMTAATDERRKQNMAKLYPLTLPTMQKAAIFRRFGVPELNELLPHCTPAVYRPGMSITVQGEIGDRMFFMARGKAQVIVQHDNGRIEAMAKELTTGDAFGEIGLIFLEPRQASVKAITACDVWQLPKDRLLEVLKAHPDLFAEAKFSANVERASRLSPLPLAVLNKLNLFRLCDPSVAVTAHSRLRPRVCDYSQCIIHQGEPADEIIFLTHGSAEVRLERPQGPSTHLGDVEAVACIGEWDVLFGAFWPVTIKALHRCDMWVLTGSDLRPLIPPAMMKPIEAQLTKQRTDVRNGVQIPTATAPIWGDRKESDALPQLVTQKRKDQTRPPKMTTAPQNPPAVIGAKGRLRPMSGPPQSPAVTAGNATRLPPATKAFLATSGGREKKNPPRQPGPSQPVLTRKLSTAPATAGGTDVQMSKEKEFLHQADKPAPSLPPIRSAQQSPQKHALPGKKIPHTFVL